MKPRAISLPVAVAMTLFAAPIAAWADANPDFDDDAKPILRQQPGLIQYVQSRFEVKDTGTAKFPGDDDRPPQPPFIFRARPIGSSGPYNLRLLIQPGPPGHILGVVDISRAHLGAPAPAPGPDQQPAMANQPPPPQQQPPSPQPSAPPQETPAPPAQAPATLEPPAQPSEPTADTPSGPIKSSGNSEQSSPSLEPPPDPAPNTH